jgi:hypothetical protein
MLLIISRCAGVFLRNTLKPSVLSLTECHSCLTLIMQPRGQRSRQMQIPLCMAKVVLQFAGGKVHHGNSVPAQQFHVRNGPTITSPFFLRFRTVARSQFCGDSSPASCPGAPLVSRKEPPHHCSAGGASAPTGSSSGKPGAFARQQRRRGFLSHGWNTDGTRMEHGWNTDGTRMEHG